MRRGARDWAEWRGWGEPFTVGIEEEAMLLEPGDLSLVHEFDRIRPRLSPELAYRLTPETHGASVELATEPHARVADCTHELVRLRAQLWPGDTVQREIAGPQLDFTRLLEVLRERFASAQISVAAQSPPNGLGVGESGSR